MGVGNHHRSEYAVEKTAGAVEAGIPTPDLEGRERKQSLIQRALAESEHLAVANQYMMEHPGCAWEDARAFAKDPKNKKLVGKA